MNDDVEKEKKNFEDEKIVKQNVSFVCYYFLR